MKTIQQILKEADPKEIEARYFEKYPVGLFDLKEDWDDMAVGDCKKTISARFRRFLERLKCMETQPDPDGEQGILFLYKTVDVMDLTGLATGLVYKEDVLAAEDVSSVETYGYELTGQAVALNFLVSDAALTKENISDLITGFLYEVSFFGYEEEHLEEFQKKLDESIRDIETHPESLIEFGLEEQLGISDDFAIRMETSKEKEAWEAYNTAVKDYGSYCLTLEIENIRDQLIGRT